MIILKRPIVTEKTMKLAQDGLYTFEVEKEASKPNIAREVANRFGVKVVNVKVINVKGENKVQRRVRKYYKRPDYKKALVQLAKGQKLSIFETQKQEEVTVTTAEGELSSRSEPIVMKEKKDLLGKTKVKIEKGATDVRPTTQRKVITGK